MASFCRVLMMLLPVKIDLVVVFAVWGSQLAIDVLALICSALHTLLSTLCCRHYLDTSLLRCSTRPAPRICFFTCLLTCRKSNFRVILSLKARSGRPLAGRRKACWRILRILRFPNRRISIRRKYPLMISYQRPRQVSSNR